MHAGEAQSWLLNINDLLWAKRCNANPGTNTRTQMEKDTIHFPKDLRLITNDKVKLTKTAAHWQPRIKGK